MGCNTFFFKTLSVSVSASLFAFLFSIPSWSHSGGLAADGCHWNRTVKPKSRHCHGGGGSGSSNSRYKPSGGSNSFGDSPFSTSPSLESNDERRSKCLSYIIVGGIKECI